jgi:hypothetical protein
MCIFPFDGKCFPLAPVNLDDGTRPDEGPHGEVGQADHSVDILARIQVLDQAQRNITPDFHIATRAPHALLSFRLGMANQVRNAVDKANKRLYGKRVALHFRDSQTPQKRGGENRRL